jgi:hypothetical protein
MKNWKLAAWTGVIILVSCLAACKKDTAGSVKIRFNHRVGTESLELSNMKYHALAGHTFSVERLRYYVSNVALHHADGSLVKLDAPHYREEGLEETAVLTLPEVPEGKYTQLSFMVGLDETTNKPLGLPNTVQNISMEWPMPGEQGYHYMKFEGKYDMMGTGVIKPFALHTGAAQNNPYYVQVSLPLTDLSVNGNTWLVTLEMDLNEWLQNPHTYDFEYFGPDIMMNLDAQQMLKENGASLFNVASVKAE